MDLPIEVWEGYRKVANILVCKLQGYIQTFDNLQLCDNFTFKYCPKSTNIISMILQ